MEEKGGAWASSRSCGTKSQWALSWADKAHRASATGPRRINQDTFHEKVIIKWVAHIMMHLFVDVFVCLFTFDVFDRLKIDFWPQSPSNFDSCMHKTKVHTYVSLFRARHHTQLWAPPNSLMSCSLPMIVWALSLDIHRGCHSETESTRPAWALKYNAHPAGSCIWNEANEVLSS